MTSAQRALIIYLVAFFVSALGFSALLALFLTSGQSAFFVTTCVAVVSVGMLPVAGFMFMGVVASVNRLVVERKRYQV